MRCAPVLLTTAFLLFPLAGPTTGPAQTLPFRTYTSRDGLPQSSVTAILQDRAGYIWLGTQGGIYRFDGIHFKSCTTVDGLTDNVVTDLIEDRTPTPSLGAAACGHRRSPTPVEPANHCSESDRPR